MTTKFSFVLMLLAIIFLPANAIDYKYALFGVDTYEEFHDGLAKYRDTENKLYGYIGTNGKPAIASQFIEADNFFNGQAIVKTPTGEGIINTQGQFLLQPNYSSIKAEKDIPGLYIIERDGGKGVFYNNRIIIGPCLNSIYTGDFPFIEGTNVLDGKDYGTIYKSGSAFHTPIWNTPVYYFDQDGYPIEKPKLISDKGLEVFSADKKYGIRNASTKKVILQPIYSYCESQMWVDERVILGDGANEYLIDGSGNIILKVLGMLSFEYTPIGKFISLIKIEGRDSYTSLYSLDGKNLVPPTNEYIEPLDFGWFICHNKGITGNYMINAKTGRKYDGKYFSYSDGMISVTDNNGKGYYYVNAETGDRLPNNYEIAYDFSEGLAVVKINGKKSVINKKGDIVFTEQDNFKIEGDKFSEGVLGVRSDYNNCYVYNPYQDQNKYTYRQDGIKSKISDRYFYLGNEALKNKEYAKAKEYFYIIMMNDPQNSSAINNYGVCLNNLGYKEEALEAYQMAADIDPDNTIAKDNAKSLKEEIKVYKRENRSNTFWNALESFGNLLGQMSNALSGGNSSYTPSNYSFGGDDLSETSGNQSASYYQTQYAKWESLAERHYNSITNLGIKVRDSKGNRSGSTLQSMGGGRYVQMKQQFREAQRQMRNTRLNAKNKGFTIPQSKWETATINY
ncbi:tetratricopeptide repeat protein [Leyella stercorea]|uniref:tetratricopeptide repeat protein n=1 Tax=Leyella stercorea TaxID=363265 RepID=UPI00242DB9B7|nr:WG repeat-containing protein [Leyella stercorea]